MESPFVTRREKRTRNASLGHIRKKRVISRANGIDADGLAKNTGKPSSTVHNEYRAMFGSMGSGENETFNPIPFRMGAHESQLSGDCDETEILGETGFTTEHLEAFDPIDGDSDTVPVTNSLFNLNNNFEGEDEVRGSTAELISKIQGQKKSAVNVNVRDSGPHGELPFSERDTGESGSPQDAGDGRTVRHDDTDPEISDETASSGLQLQTGDGISLSLPAHDFSRVSRVQNATDCQLGSTEQSLRHRRGAPKTGERAQHDEESDEMPGTGETKDSGDEKAIESQWNIDDSDIEFSFKRVEVNKISEKFQRLVEARNQSFRILPKVAKGKRAENKRNRTLQAVDKRTENIKKSWILALRTLYHKKRDFFSSKEAILEDDSPIRKGKPSYESLPITQSNNADIQEIFLTEYDRKLRSGGSYNSFLQLVMVAG